MYDIRKIIYNNICNSNIVVLHSKKGHVVF